MREINISQLPAAYRRPLWAALQADAPDLAALLGDEMFRGLAVTFAGQVVLDVNALPPSAVAVLQEYARVAA